MKYYIADAFAEAPFTGNPAGICVLDEWPPDKVMQDIASQNNLSETAFFVKEGPGVYKLRWFTPRNEVDLCGHATLASGFIVMNYLEPELEKVMFSTVSGNLGVERRGERYVLDFPTRKPAPVTVTSDMGQAVGAKVLEAYGSRDLVLILPSEKEVRELKPDLSLVAAIPGYFGVCVTAKGNSADFVSRFFAPLASVPEDPVTGSTHCNLIPLWSEKLGKKEMTALQLSERGGKLYVRDLGERVEMAGRARLYLKGEIFL